jgi:hypothetical protein
VKYQEASEKKRKAFQYIRKDEDNDEGNEITLVDKGKRVASGSGSTQTTINQLLKKDLREEASRQIARFFYTSAIPFNYVKNPEFVKALELVAKFFLPISIRYQYVKFISLVGPLLYLVAGYLVPTHLLFVSRAWE